MDAHRAAEQVQQPGINAIQPAHFRRHAGLRRVMLERFQNVGVRFPIAAENLPEHRHQPFQVTEVERTPEGIVRLAKIKREQAAARFRDAHHLAQALFQVRQVSQPISDGDNVEAIVGKRNVQDRKSTRLNSSHGYISYAVFCLKKKKCPQLTLRPRLPDHPIAAGRPQAVCGAAPPRLAALTLVGQPLHSVLRYTVAWWQTPCSLATRGAASRVAPQATNAAATGSRLHAQGPGCLERATARSGRAGSQGTWGRLYGGPALFILFFFNDPPPPELSPFPLHNALPT